MSMAGAHPILVFTRADAVTVLLFDREAGLARRVWSSMPGVFSATGHKTLTGAPWEFPASHVGPALVSRGAAAIRAVFPDHEVILGQGIGMVVNLPLLRSGVCVGTVNCLYRDAGHAAAFDAMIPDVSHQVWMDLGHGPTPAG